MQGEGRAPLRQRGMGGEAEELLHADRQHRPALGLIVHRHPAARGRREMGGRLGVKLALEVPGHQGVEGGVEIVGGDGGQTGASLDEGRKP